MSKLALMLVCFAFLQIRLPAQVPARSVRANGNAVVSLKPDQIVVDLGVTTQAATAQEASEQNATQMTAVLNQVRQVLGPTADIKTIAYSVNPTYRYPQGLPPVLSGFSASNTVEVTSGDMASIVRVIDTSAQAGATNIQGLRFTVKDSEAARAQALAAAAKQALAHAQAIASGLNVKIGGVITAQEGSVITPSPVGRDAAATPTPTPIEVGLVQVSATVSLDVELIQ